MSFEYTFFFVNYAFALFFTHTIIKFRHNGIFFVINLVFNKYNNSIRGKSFEMNHEERPFSVNSVSDVGIDVTDEDLKKLADSFAKGREELQKVFKM